MAFSFRLPDIGEGVVEGEIVGWKVKEGDVVKLDQPIVEVMTDKATVEIPSPRAGTIAKINYADGQICPVGQVLVVIDDGASAVAAPAAASASVAHGSVAPPVAAASSAAPAAAPARNGHGTPAVPAPIFIDATVDRARTLATPATRRLARSMGVELNRVPASGKHGRVTSDDVRRASAAPRGAAPGVPVPMNPAAMATGPMMAVLSQPPVVVARGGDEERIPFRGLRRKIAESMSRSKNTAAHFTYVEEVDMTDLVAVREQAKNRAADRGVKLTYLPFIVKAAVSGLRKWPMLNASLDESTQELVRKKYYHMGIAAQGPQGLAVSVVRDADKRSIFDLAREIDRLGDAVKNGTATRDDLTGSTFTITSLGKLGGVLATPIINFPEVAIMGVHKIEERPAVRKGQIVIRHLMNLSISVDHRLADGWDGAMFLQEVKSLLEDPTTMFMEMV